MNVTTIAIFVLGVAVLVTSAARNWPAALLLFLALVCQAALWYRDWRDR